MKKININKIFKTIKKSTIKHTPDILVGFGIASGITSTVLAVKATPKALMLIEKEKSARRTNHEDDELTKREIINIAWKPYIPAAVSAVAGITCILGAHSVHTKRNAVIATAYKLTETAFQDYKDTVVEEIGTEKEKEVRDKVASKRLKNNPMNNNEVVITGNGTSLFYDTEFNTYFESDMNSVRSAINDLNEQILNQDYASVNELYYMLNIPPMRIGDRLGWSAMHGKCEVSYGSDISSDGRPCITLTYNVKPRDDFADLY